MVDYGQPVPEGFQPMPQGHFCCGVELLKPTRFNRFHEFGQVIVESVEDHIQPAAFNALVCCWIPEFHTSILFEDVFDDKPFSQQNKEK